MGFDVGDRLAIHELLGWYGHLLDDRRFDDLDQVFTADAVYDGEDFGMGTTRSLAELRALWTGPTANHPLAHHATNIVITAVDADTAEVVSKGIGVGPKGRVGSVVYRDTVVRTADGWRMRHRAVTLRRPDV